MILQLILNIEWSVHKYAQFMKENLMNTYFKNNKLALPKKTVFWS